MWWYSPKRTSSTRCPTRFCSIWIRWQRPEVATASMYVSRTPCMFPSTMSETTVVFHVWKYKWNKNYHQSMHFFFRKFLWLFLLLRFFFSFLLRFFFTQNIETFDMKNATKKKRRSKLTVDWIEADVHWDVFFCWRNRINIQKHDISENRRLSHSHIENKNLPEITISSTQSIRFVLTVIFIIFKFFPLPKANAN